MAWVKLHDDILGDPKLMRAARMGATELALLPWLIVFASKAEDEGRLSVGASAAEPEDLAYLIPGVTPARVEGALRSLVAIGVLEADERDGCLRFVKWDERQAKPSDSKTAIRERVRKHRQRTKTVTPARNTTGALQGVTATENHSELSDVTPRNATEKRRGEEKRGEKKRGEARGASWAAALRDRWTQRVGQIGASTIRRELGGSVAVHGEDVVLRAIDTYADVRHDEGKPLKLVWFAEEIVHWIRRSEPLVDGDGILTARGMAVASA